MTNFSPNVTPREFDFSDYAVRASTSILGVVGYATKGPTHTPIFIANERELIDTFGYPEVALVGQDYVTKNLVLSGLQFLREGNQMVVVRCNTGAQSATTTLVDGDDADVLTVTAISPGSWAATQSLTVRTSAGSYGSGYYKLEILVDGIVREKYDNLTTLTADPTNWASARMNLASFLVRVQEASGLVPGEIPVAGSFALTGGSDGGSQAASDFIAASQGLNVLKDRDLVTVNMLITPGASREVSDNTQTVARYALQICEIRGDCTYLMDPVWGLATPAQVRDSVNGGSGYGEAFDSSFGGIFAPWISVYDAYNRKTVWAPPSAFVAAQCAYTNRVAQPWFAPAGLERGRIRLGSGTKFNFTLDELELIQAPREIVNPIRSITKQGIVIWGQKTMQRKSSALDRLNVRFMLNYAKASVVDAAKSLIFAQSDSKTWRKFVQLVTPLIQQIKDTQGLYDYRIICDASTNPPAIVDQNMMVAKILLKPTKTAEFITVDFNVLSTGASFNEFI